MYMIYNKNRSAKVLVAPLLPLGVIVKKIINKDLFMLIFICIEYKFFKGVKNYGNHKKYLEKKLISNKQRDRNFGSSSFGFS